MKSTISFIASSRKSVVGPRGGEKSAMNTGRLRWAGLRASVTFIVDRLRLLTLHPHGPSKGGAADRFEVDDHAGAFAWLVVVALDLWHRLEHSVANLLV